MMACVPGDDVPELEDYDPYMVQNFTAISIPESIPTWVAALKITFYAIAFLIDLVGNSMVILIIVLNKRMKSTTNVLLLNLAVSDLMVGCFCMWVHLGNSISTEWPFGDYVCKVNIFMQVVAVTSSVLTLTSISVERFFAIVFPLRKFKSPVFTTVVVITNWVISVGIAMPHLVVRRTFEYFWSDRHEVWCEEVWPKVFSDEQCHTEMPARVIYYTVVCVVMYFIPIFVMLCAYSIIVVKMIFRKRPGCVISSAQQMQDKSRRKVIKMLIAVLVSFIVCWTPQQSLVLWDIYRERNSEENTQVNEHVLNFKYAALFVAYSNSAINPILYGGFNENFRKGFKDAFKCFLWKKRNAVFPAGIAGNRQTSNLNTPNTTPVLTSTI